MAVKKIVKRVGKEYFKTVSNMLTSAFGLVAALAWNEFVKALISRYLNRGAALLSHLIYASAVTVLAVGVTMWLSYWAKKLDQANEEGK